MGAIVKKLKYQLAMAKWYIRRARYWLRDVIADANCFLGRHIPISDCSLTVISEQACQHTIVCYNCRKYFTTVASALGSLKQKSTDHARQAIAQELAGRFFR